MNRHKTISILSLSLFLISCMIPAFDKCWDEDIAPKWYASLGVVLLALIIVFVYPQKSKNIILYWRKALPISAGFGLLFQLCYIIFLICKSDIPLLGFSTRGTFGNPSDLAVTICLLYPLSLIINCNKRKYFQSGWNIFTTVVSLLLLICTQSRTGLIIFSLYLAILFYKYIKIKNIYKIIIGLITIFSISIFLATSCKLDSSKGRTFILLRTAELICQKPITGYGRGNFEKYYMEHQASYFKQHPQTEYSNLADNIRHPLNEFAILWVEYGILGPTFLSLIILVPLFTHRKYLKVLMTELCLLLFCLFSYPLTLPLPTIILITIPIASLLYLYQSSLFFRITAITFITTITLWLVGAFYIDNLMSSASFYAIRKKHNRSLYKYAQLNKVFEVSYFQQVYLSRYKTYLYNHSRELYSTSNFKNSLIMISRTENILTNYDTQLLRADIYYHIQEYHKALKTYETAHNMCPVRFAPLEGLLNCYQKLDDYVAERNIANQILQKTIKINSIDIARIHDKAKHVLQDSATVCDSLQIHNLN